MNWGFTPAGSADIGLRDRLPAEVFGEPWSPPASDGSGQDRVLLRRADAQGRPIAVAPVPETGLGLAINDRLRRAAAPR